MQLGRFIAPPGLFRLSLAFVVFVSHCTRLELGSAAVYLFFMLSGFWVRQMWSKEYAPTTAPYRTFIISRLWRLLPVHYIALLMLIPLQYFLWGGILPMAGWPEIHFALSHVFLLGYATLAGALQLNPVVWSLDIELQFYLLAPLLIILLSRYPWFSLPRLALYGFALGGLAVFVTCYGTHFNTGFLPMYLAFFLIGLHSAHFGWKPRKAIAVGALATAIALIAGCVMLPATRAILLTPDLAQPVASLLAYNSYANIILALLLSAYAIATVRKVPVKGTWLAKIDRDLSNITYEVYLLHTTVLSVMFRFASTFSKHDRVLVTILAWFASMLLSFIVYRLFDRPIDRLRIAYVRSRRRALPPTPVLDRTERALPMAV
jgi:peptidoglycan/LPS O-acetylase OafA/YrhL